MRAVSTAVALVFVAQSVVLSMPCRCAAADNTEREPAAHACCHGSGDPAQNDPAQNDPAQRQASSPDEPDGEPATLAARGLPTDERCGVCRCGLSTVATASLELAPPAAQVALLRVAEPWVRPAAPIPVPPAAALRGMQRPPGPCLRVWLQTWRC